MVRIFLNDVLINDVPDLGTLTVSIERENGFSSSNQILRDKFESGGLDFWGDGYTILCNAKKSNSCQKIDIVFEYKCNDLWKKLFSGTLQIKEIEFDLRRCIAKVKTIKDNSFSGLLQDYITTEINLYNTQTKQCQPLTLIDKSIIFNKSTSGSDLVGVVCFDALDTLNYLAAFITDNNLTIKSDFLTNNKQAITLGYNLHNTTGAIELVYPKTSFQKVFDELRKKFRLYMIVEYEASGVPYIRIEQENYSYDDTTELMSFDEIPFDAVESFDDKKLYNSIIIGSNDYKLQGESAPDYEQNKLVAWNKETYNSCGGCTADKDSENVKLDLVSDFIIDSNVIYEALNAVPTTLADKYSNDEKVFLVEYATVSGVDTATIYADGVSGKNVYNWNLRNQAVINNWVGYSPACLALVRYSTNGFKYTNKPFPDTTFDGSGALTGGTCDFIRVLGTYVGSMKSHIYFANEVFDNNSNVFSQSANTAPDIDTGGQFDTFGMSYFKTPTAGNYAFRAASKLKMIVPHASYQFATDINFTVRFVVYADNTFATITDSGVLTSIENLAPSATVSTFDINSPLFNLSVGNCVTVEIDITSITVPALPFYYFTQIYDSVFELVEGDGNCEDVNDTDLTAKPNLLSFTAPYCYTDLQTLVANKRGYISVKNKKFYINKVDWEKSGKGRFSLLGSDTLCGC